MPANGTLHGERYVLGAVLASREIRQRALGELTPQHFYSEEHRRLFAAISQTEATDLSGAVNPRELSSEVSGLARDILMSAPGTSQYDRHAAEIVEAARARATATMLASLRQSLEGGAASEVVIGEGLSGFEGLLAGGRSQGAVHISEGAGEVRERAQTIRSNKGIVGLRTGFGVVDRKLGGLQSARNYVLAARAGVGKSTFAGVVAYNVALQGKRVAIQSLEMPVADYLERMARAAAGITEGAWESGGITDADMERLESSLTKLSGLDLHVDDDPGATPERLRRNIVRLKPDLVIVDYLQRMSPSERGRSEYEDVSRLSLEVDRLKAVYDVPILSVMQLNRNAEHREGKKPSLADLRSSGQLEQDANVVLLLHRDSMHNEDADPDQIDVMCAKNRHGESNWLQKLWRARGLAYLTDDRSMEARGA